MTTHPIRGPRFEARELPFHRLARPLPAGLTAREAVQREGLDFTVTKVLQDVSLPNGKREPIPGRYITLRPPTRFDPVYRPLGFVAEDYTILQNLDLATILDDTGFTTHWDVDAVGFINAGQKLFISLAMGPIELAHERIDEYCLIVNGHDGATATTAHYTPSRTLCTNALLLGVRAATIAVSLQHERNIRTELGPSLAGLQQTRDRLRGTLEGLSHIRITHELLTQTLRITYPDPTIPTRLLRAMATPDDAPLTIDDGTTLIPGPRTPLERARQTFDNGVRRQNELRTVARELYDQYNDTGHHANHGTAWNLYQAITELSNHREGHLRKSGPDNIAQSVLFGPRSAEMGRAFTTLAAHL